MRTRPAGLNERAVLQRAAASWGLDIDQMRYLPLGFGSYHWLAQTSAGERYFLTVDDLECKPWLGADAESAFTGLRAAFDTALALHDLAGLDFVVQPIRALDGEPTHRLTSGYSLAVFPFVDGTGGEWGDEVSQADRYQLTRLFADLHRATPAVAALAPRRGFELPARADLETALTELDQTWTGGPFAEPARRALAANADAVGERLRSFDRLTAQVTERNAGLVVTHGEPHPGNLIRAAGRFRLVDWDTVALAPPERDLWMLDDGTADALAPYTEATGRAVDPAAVSLYRLTWVLADLAAFTSLVRSDHGADPDTEKAWTALLASLPSRSPAGAERELGGGAPWG